MAMLHATIGHKAFHILDSLYDKGIDLVLFFTGYYPVVFVGPAGVGTAICLLQDVILKFIQGIGERSRGISKYSIADRQ